MKNFLRYQLFTLTSVVLLLNMVSYTIGIIDVNFTLALLGASIYILPTIIFTYFLFKNPIQITPRQKINNSLQQLLGAFYFGEFLKMIFTIALFAMAYKTRPELSIPSNSLFLFAGFLIAYLSGMFSATKFN